MIVPDPQGNCPSGYNLVTDRQDLRGAYCLKAVGTSNPIPRSTGSGYSNIVNQPGGGTYTSPSGQAISQAQAQKLGIID
jgi:hypothetical protein